MSAESPTTPTAEHQRRYWSDPAAASAAGKVSHQNRLTLTAPEKEALSAAYALLHKIVQRQPEKFSIDPNPVEQHVMDILRAEHGWTPCSTVAAQASILMITARRILQKLVNSGLAESRSHHGYRLAPFGDDDVDNQNDNGEVGSDTS